MEPIESDPIGCEPWSWRPFSSTCSPPLVLLPGSPASHFLTSSPWVCHCCSPLLLLTPALTSFLWGGKIDLTSLYKSHFMEIFDQNLCSLLFSVLSGNSFWTGNKENDLQTKLEFSLKCVGALGFFVLGSVFSQPGAVIC